MNISKEKENLANCKKSELFYRVVSAIFFIPVLIIIIYFGGIYYLLLIELGIGIGAYEFYKILEARGLKPFTFFGILAALILGWTAYFASHIFTFFTITALFFIVSIIELYRKQLDRAIFHISATLFGTFYVGWLMSHLVLLRQIPIFLFHPEIMKMQKIYYFYPDTVNMYNNGAFFAIVPFILAWVNDTGAFFFGRKFGKHKLFIKISPNKSWEGCIGGGISAFIGMLILKYVFNQQWLSLIHCLMLSILGAFASPIGDLVESLLKRDANIKDAGTLIPGHGGVLDRFDSILFVAPIVYYYLRFFIFNP